MYLFISRFVHIEYIQVLEQRDIASPTRLNHLIPWIISFLSNRRQGVNIGEAFSDCLPVNAGVPQGTKLGPILFLIMINDLSISTPETNLWKFVDDVSISERLTKNGGASFQSNLDTVSSWAPMNLMKLNAKKCKELRVCLV